MRGLPRAALLLAWPLVALGAVAFALLLLAFDALCWPIALLLRRRPPAVAPASRNASVVVLNYDGLHYLKELMPSLRRAVAACPGDHEVLVVDNGSADGSAEWLAAECPWARLVRLPENRFFIRGNRAGVEQATRDILVFLNNDMRVEEGFLIELLRPFSDPSLFAATARIEMDGERKETGFCRGFVRRGELRLVQEEGHAGPPQPVLWAGGGSSAYDRKKYLAVGGFEDLYTPCYVEDVSLSYQAWRRGWRSLYVHESVVHHAHRGTSSKVFSRAGVERLNFRNKELFFVRSITDPRLVLLHGLWFGWNLRKHARLLGLPLSDLVYAALAVLPRLPRAMALRAASLRDQRRSDAAIVAATMRRNSDRAAASE